MGNIKVLVVDDHQMLAEALAEWLNRADDIDVVAIARTGEEGVDLAVEHHPDVVLMDFRLPDIPGTEAARRLHRLLPSTRIVMVTGDANQSTLVEAIQVGCVGYITKGNNFGDLVSSIRMAYEGETLVSPDMLPKILRQIRRQTDPARKVDLTPRELEVLKLLARGSSNPEIASILGLSLLTVRTHVQNVIRRLDAHSKLEAVAVAVRGGIVEVD